MKKGLAFLLTVVMAVGMITGCGSDEGTTLREMKVEKYVTLGDYKGINVTLSTAEVEAQVKNQLLQMAYYGAMTAGEEDKITNRAVENGDMVNINYSGKKDDVAFEGGTAADQFLLIGSGSFIAGFEEGLVGVKPGETVDLNLTFPEGYQSEDLAGQDVVFTVTVNYIYDSSEEYDYYYQVALENAVVETFVNQCVFSGELPESLVTTYRNNFQTSITAEATAYGMDADTLSNYYYGMDLATFLDTYAPESAKQSLAFQAVANVENLNLADEAFEARLSETATDNGYASVEEMMGTNTKENYREYFMMEDVVEFLIDNAVVTAE